MVDVIIALAVIYVGLLLVGVFLALVGLAFGLLGVGMRGAFSLLEFASEQGFIGIAVYFACWFFMFPLMLIASVIVGKIANMEEHISSTTSPPSSETLAAQWAEEDRRYEEHKQKLIDQHSPDDSSK